VALPRTVLFDLDRHGIRGDAEEVLREVAAALAAHAEVEHVLVMGHTDVTGPARHNAWLSSARAAAVKGWLVERGVAAERLEVQSFEASRPAAANDSREGRARNRRVDVMVKGEGS
jgi:OmpA-OmpF porin, OOP family